MSRVEEGGTTRQLCRCGGWAGHVKIDVCRGEGMAHQRVCVAVALVRGDSVIYMIYILKKTTFTIRGVCVGWMGGCYILYTYREVTNNLFHPSSKWCLAANNNNISNIIGYAKNPPIKVTLKTLVFCLSFNIIFYKILLSKSKLQVTLKDMTF